MPNTRSFPAVSAYALRLAESLQTFDWAVVETLAGKVLDLWGRGSTLWICGNGGSAANAVHWANDFLYPVAKRASRGARIQALTENPAVVTCLGNDIGYEKIFSYQLRTFAAPGDLLIALSGSGNSPNIIEALKAARDLGVETCAILGFDGGAALSMADLPVHFAVDDMQVAEDAQMVVCHALVQALVDHPARPVQAS